MAPTARLLFGVLPLYTQLVTQVLTRAGRGLTGTYPALGYRGFRLYWGGTVVSLTGFWMQALAQGWLVLELTNSPMMLGLVGGAWAAPNIALSLIGGVVADRVDRRRLLMATRSVGVVASLSTALLIATELIQVWHVFAFALLMGAVTAFDMPSSQAFVPSLVQQKHLMNAIALVSAAFNGTRIVGPSLAGVLIARFGVGGCYLISGLAALTMILALAAIKAPTTTTSKDGHLLAHVREGLAYVRRDELRMTLLAMVLVNSLFGMAYPAMMPVVARDVLAAGPQGYGALMSADGLGSLAGTLVVASLRGLPRLGPVALASSAAFGVGLIGFALSQELRLSLALMTAVGFANATYGTLVNTLLQSKLDDEFRGRVLSVLSLVMSTMPLAGLQAGALTTAFGAAFSLTLNGAVVIVASLAVALFVPRLRQV